MKAMVIRQYGGPDVFVQEEIATPAFIPRRHVLIQVKATSVNPVDYKIRSGLSGKSAPAFPAVLHGDVAGVITQTGEDVNHLRVGDEVYACAGGVRGTAGALAEYMLADADLVALKPKRLTMEEAAALPLVAITAWEGLVDRARVSPGQSVLVHAGAGGVGHVAIQLAKCFGARVIATASNEKKIAIAKALGADEGINYRKTSVQDYVEACTGGRGFDIVFDTVGRENLQRSFEAVANGGQVICIQSNSVQDLTPLHAKSVSLHAVMMLLPLWTGEGRKRHGDILSKVARLVDEGKVKPLLHAERFPFTKVAEAHRLLESGKANGKVVLTNDLLDN